ncbi:hypothetical protein [Methanovulcanius yangii]|uniref:hypothetical protein n=1 Tax=Methanovulcanius yangii TaxID=1789227 RepID=UPI0029CA97C9|nr:hypothetical protein [Methanovulcanius yangii]
MSVAVRDVSWVGENPVIDAIFPLKPMMRCEVLSQVKWAILRFSIAFAIVAAVEVSDLSDVAAITTHRKRAEDNRMMIGSIGKP